MKRLMKMCVLFLLAMAAAVPEVSAQAARVFLSGTGNDLADCSNAATPCRSLQGAINQAATGAEVVVLSSGGFGGATISKSITVNAPAGVVAFIGRTITVTIGVSDVVVLRGLSMNGATFADTVGINFTAGGTLIVENSVIAGFGELSLNYIGDGIDATGPGSNLVINNCEIRKNHGEGVYVSSAASQINLTVENTRFVQNGLNGLYFRDHARATVRNCVFTGHHINNTASGIKIEQYATDSATTVVVEGCLVTNNDYGLGIYAAALTAPVIRVSSTMIVNHTIGLLDAGPGLASIVSYGNNRLGGNSSGNTFTGPIAQQ